MLPEFFANLAQLSEVYYVVICAGLGALLLLMEICTPSFGLFTGLALTSFITAVVFAFMISSFTGFMVMVGIVVATPFYLNYLVKLLPKTPIGKYLMLPKLSKEISNAVPEYGEFENLVGKIGVAETLLRPAGTISIDSKRYPARAQLSIIQPGQKVRIVQASSNDLLVVLAADEESS